VGILLFLPFLICFILLLILLIFTYGISSALVIQENPEFDLHFEKVYRWVASSTAEKNSFISCIWKLNQRYLRKKVEFVNVSSQLLEGMTAL
jgi:inhibitor of KinA sporulation pathway (predicted exonuclease)